MKTKLILMLSGLTMAAQNVFAQDMFGSFATDMQQEVESLFPVIIILVFIISGLFNLGKFFGENRDVKQGISNIVLYVGGTLLLMGVYKYLSGLSL